MALEKENNLANQIYNAFCGYSPGGCYNKLTNKFEIREDKFQTSQSWTAYYRLKNKELFGCDGIEIVKRYSYERN